MLERGGNAVDAAIAVVAAQGVVAPETCGLGGDLFALIHAPGWERPRALNASGRSGSKVDAEELRSRGLLEIPRDHPAAVTIPGCVDGLVELSSTLGSVDLGEAMRPAIQLAAEGFEVSTEQAAAFARQTEIYGTHPAVAGFYPHGEAVRVGDTVSRPDLAQTLRAIVSDGREGFYGGVAGEDIVAAVDGITSSDLAVRQAEWIDPIGIEVRGLTAWTTPPNSQGYLAPATLAVMDLLRVTDDPQDPVWWHSMIESYRALAWERDDIVADPDHVALPVDLLLDPARLRRAAASVDPTTAGVWPAAPASGAGTAFMCVADAHGMAVSIIQSNYHGTGSTFGAARSGFLLQDRGRGFTLMPGHPNELGPGKRPLHTLSPTLWAEGNRPRWLIGTRGGNVQPQLIAQMAARAMMSGQPLAEAQGAPRWTIGGFGPGTRSHPVIEPGLSGSITTELERRGHRISIADGPQPGWGPMSIIELDGSSRSTAPDPRVDTTAALVF